MNVNNKTALAKNVKSYYDGRSAAQITEEVHHYDNR